MDFAKTLMKKYGWTEGEGLGKNNTGIKKALKANLKFDTAGLGVDEAADFNNHWWERVFNEAANNIDVKTEDDKISMQVKDKNCVEITTKEYSIKKLKKVKDNNESYNNFIKTATLTNKGNEESVPNRLNIEDIKITEFKPLTDEELFAACGGRTAHKGARHGLKLTGKLSRIEEQEKLLLSKIQNNLSKSETNEWTLVKHKKKKKEKKNKCENLIENHDESEKLLNEMIENTEYHIKSKKKKKQQKELENSLSNSLDLICIEERNNNVETMELSKEKYKKKKKKITECVNYRNDKGLHVQEEIEDVVVRRNQDDQQIQLGQIKNNQSSENNNLLISSKSEKRKMKSESKKSAKKLKKHLDNVTESLDKFVTT